MGMLNWHPLHLGGLGRGVLEYATRECHDCGRLVSRATMQRHSERRHSSTNFTITDSGAKRRSSERYSEREVLVCADCGRLRGIWQWTKIIGALLALGAFVFLMNRGSGDSAPAVLPDAPITTADPHAAATAPNATVPQPSDPIPTLAESPTDQPEPLVAPEPEAQAPPSGEPPPNLDGLY
jgi:hypothetical protein